VHLLWLLGWLTNRLGVDIGGIELDPSGTEFGTALACMIYIWLHFHKLCNAILVETHKTIVLVKQIKQDLWPDR